MVNNQLTENEENDSKLNAKKSLSNSEIISQAVLFIFAGYETVSTTLLFIAYNLASNVNSQNKLIAQVDEIYNKFVKKKLKLLWLFLSRSLTVSFENF